MNTTSTNSDDLHRLRVAIHFKENSIPSIHAGYMTVKSIAEIQSLIDQAYAKGFKDRTSVRGYTMGYEAGKREALADVAGKVEKMRITQEDAMMAYGWADQEWRAQNIAINQIIKLLKEKVDGENG